MPQPKRFKKDEWMFLTQKVWASVAWKFTNKENAIIQKFITQGTGSVEEVQEPRKEELPV